MKTLIALSAWCLLLVLCWPLALLALVLWPIAWLLSLPFRLLGITFSALFAFLSALLMLPARVLGWKPTPSSALRAGLAHTRRAGGCLPFADQGRCGRQRWLVSRPGDCFASRFLSRSCWSRACLAGLLPASCWSRPCWF